MDEAQKAAAEKVSAELEIVCKFLHNAKEEMQKAGYGPEYYGSALTVELTEMAVKNGMSLVSLVSLVVEGYAVAAAASCGCGHCKAGAVH